MIAAAAERLLRGDADATPSRAMCLAIGIVGSAAAGLALGASSGSAALAVFAAIKVPLLLALATVLCLPSFYVVNSVLGLALGALAPVLVWTSLAVLDPYALTLLDALTFAGATWCAQQVLHRHYAALIARDARHRVALRSWLVLYAFAGVQLAWVLRPFRGTEGFGVQFLRPEALEQNAYVVVFEHLARLFR